MRGGKLGLIPRISIALALVGLIPLLALALPLLGVNRDALEEQVLQTHSMAARTAAARATAYLDGLATTADSLAGNAALLAAARSPAAQQMLSGVLEARADVAALVVANERGELVIQVQRQGLGEVVAQILAQRPATAGPTAFTSADGGRWLLLERPLPEELGTLLVVADFAPLAAAVDTIEIGDQADLVLATAGGEVIAGTTNSLAAFPAALVAAGGAGEGGALRPFGASRYEEAGDGVLGAHAPVAGSDWFVASRQPASVAERVEVRLRRRSFTALGLALVLVVALSAAAHATLVKPIRSLGEAQRRLAGMSSEPHGGNEIADLEESFAVLERRLRDQQELGKVFLGRYQVIEMVGEGAMGTVFLGWDPRLQRQVALKTVRLTTELVRSVRRRLSSQLLREATAAARFSHPNIVAIYDFEDTPEVAFIAMEYIDGIGLDHLLSRRRKLAEDETLCLAEAVAKALGAAHKLGLVHRDIKPSNVLLGYDGAIKVADFGIADFISAMTPESETVFGTPGYLAPEVLLGEGFEPRSDLFSLGVILYEGLSGVHPFFAQNLREMALRTVNHQPEPLRKLRPELAQELEALIAQLLHKRREGRPASAEAVVERIETITARRKLRWDADALPRIRERGTATGGLASRLIPTLQSGPRVRNGPSPNRSPE